MIKEFVIEGKFKMGKEMVKFKKIVRAVGEKEALEKIYSKLCGTHKCNRRTIKIEKIEVKNGNK